MPVFTLTLPMHYTHGQRNYLDKVFRVCCNIQNNLISTGGANIEIIRKYIERQGEKY